ncbi:MAG: hypothetical protein ACO4AC_06850 [Pseudohongiellaceae bacterium]|jgi:hypothetical protein
MDIFRYSSNAYGQQVLGGISFDLIYVFAGVSAAIILAHFFYRLLNKKD